MIRFFTAAASCCIILGLITIIIAQALALAFNLILVGVLLLVAVTQINSLVNRCRDNKDQAGRYNTWHEK